MSNILWGLGVVAEAALCCVVERSELTSPTRSSSAKSICATLYDGKKEDIVVVAVVVVQK